MRLKGGLRLLAVAAVTVLVLAVAWSGPSAEDANLAGTPTRPERSSEASPGEVDAGAAPRAETGADHRGDDAATPGQSSPGAAARPKPNRPVESFDPAAVSALKAALRRAQREDAGTGQGRPDAPTPRQEADVADAVPDPADVVPDPADVAPEPGDGQEPAPLPTLDFVLSSFNVLGSSHTAGRGQRPTMASGPTRIRRAAGLLARHSVDVVGFQEFQLDQQRAFRRHTNGRYDFYPGFSKGGRGSNNSIAWRRDVWEVVEAETIPIPYFEGSPWPMPVVLLRHKETGLSAFFSNFHNPASTRHHPKQGGWRRQAALMEATLVRQLQASSDHPVFLLGDLNERRSAFCLMTGPGGMVAANGGSNDGQCRPPRDIGIDWIFGSPDVRFYDYRADRGPLVRRVTDHPMVVTGVRIGGE